MTVKEFTEKIVQIKGVSEVKSYTLVSNYGVTFKKGGYKFDVRYWANCYGEPINEWDITGSAEFYKDGKKIDGKKNSRELSDLIPTIEAL